MKTHTNTASDVAIIIPAKNEAENLSKLLPELRQLYPDFDVLVVDDASTDNTRDICEKSNARLVSHPYGMGNGAAVKTGARAANSDILIFMDGDGQHLPTDVQKLLDKLAEGYDMVVGARNWSSQANVGRGFANMLYNRLANFMVGHKVHDLTSGFRAVRAKKFKEYLYLLPNGFSYPTTITMAFFRAGYTIAYLPIRAASRGGQSHLHPIKDGVRFFLIIFRVGTLYSPLKLFFPISACFFLTGVAYYLYTFILEHRFTNMSALLFITAILIFLIGLISEQITNLLYAGRTR